MNPTAGQAASACVATNGKSGRSACLGRRFLFGVIPWTAILVGLVSCGSERKPYATFPLPDGDSLIIERAEDDPDLPLAHYYCRLKSERSEMREQDSPFWTSYGQENPVFALVSPGSDSVVAVVREDSPLHALVLCDFRERTFVPHSFCPADVAPHPGDKRFRALQTEYQAMIRMLLGRLEKGTGQKLLFHDASSDKDIEAP